MLPYNDSFIYTAWHPKTWMHDLHAYIEHLAITQMLLLGSHNAGTYNIVKKSPFGKDVPGLLYKHAGLCSVARFLARGVSAPWAKCQEISIRAQLDLGVRYLDLRIIPNPKDNDRLYITHGQIGVSLATVVEEVKAFLDDSASANEFIVLDFQHLFDLGSSERRGRFVAEINPLMNHFIPADVPLTTPLSTLWKRSPEQRIFFVLGSGGNEVVHPAARIRSECMVSCWVNKSSPKKLLQALDQLLRDDINCPVDGNVPSKLYVTQAVCTPGTASIFSGLFNVRKKIAAGIHDLAMRVNSPLLEWFCLLNAHSQLDGGAVTVPPGLNTHRNILMLDYVNLGSCCVLGDTRELNGVGMCVYLNMLQSSRLERTPEALMT